jgi:hypothetical protein
MDESEINGRIGYALGFVRRLLPYRVYTRNFDDIRQTAAIYAMQTESTPKRVALDTWSDIRRQGRVERRLILRECWESIPCESSIRHEPIPSRYLTKCSDRERTAICLFYECDQPIKAIARSVGTTKKGAGLLLTRGRAKIKKALINRDDNPT